MVHVGRKIWKMAENRRKCADSWLGQIGYMSDVDRDRNCIRSYVPNIPLGRRPNPCGFGNGRGAK